ncbi:hypothetical protein SLA2020_160190 [Shorea laevis]
MDRVAKLASQKAVVIFNKSSCCMCDAIKRLFYEPGVSHAICELNQGSGEKEMGSAPMQLGCNQAIPKVFNGGKFVGSANTIITLHLNGSLKNLLKNASALWLSYITIQSLEPN